MTHLINHELVENLQFRHIGYEEKPVKGRDGQAVKGFAKIIVVTALNVAAAEKLR